MMKSPLFHLLVAALDLGGLLTLALDSGEIAEWEKLPETGLPLKKELEMPC